MGAGGIAMVMFFLYVRIRQSREHREMTWFAEGVFRMPASPGFISELASDARKRGLERQFQAALDECRGIYGRDALKVGHVQWAFMRAEGKIAPELPPRFD
jgi:hypothetical protein